MNSFGLHQINHLLLKNQNRKVNGNNKNEDYNHLIVVLSVLAQELADPLRNNRLGKKLKNTIDNRSDDLNDELIQIRDELI